MYKAAVFLTTLLAVAMPSTADDKFRKSVDGIPGEYIVVFEDSIPKSAVAKQAEVLARLHGGRVVTTWSSALKGFAVYFPEAAARALSANPKVAYVEENSRIFLSTTQPEAPWHLDRVDQRSGTNTTYHYCTTGGVFVYVIDTGVWAGHSEFSIPNLPGASRVFPGADFAFPWTGGTETDPCSGTDNYGAGHGTSVASVLAGNTFGVAKAANIIPVRVFNCELQGTAWTLVNGIDWVYNDFNNNGYKAVVNMSTFRRVDAESADAVNAVEQAVQRLITIGLQVVASANNQNADACATTPARMADVITVAGTNPADVRWVTAPPFTGGNPCNNQGSNFGTCVDLFAPSEGIRSAHILHANAERAATFPGFPECDARSGTSFSAPIVSGVVARYLAAGGPDAPAQIRSWLLSDAGSTPDVVTNEGLGSPRRFVYADSGGECP